MLCFLHVNNNQNIPIFFFFPNINNNQMSKKKRKKFIFPNSGKFSARFICKYSLFFHTLFMIAKNDFFFFVCLSTIDWLIDWLVENKNFIWFWFLKFFIFFELIDFNVMWVINPLGQKKIPSAYLIMINTVSEKLLNFFLCEIQQFVHCTNDDDDDDNHNFIVNMAKWAMYMWLLCIKCE